MPLHNSCICTGAQCVGIVGRVETGRGADAYGWLSAALHPQPQVFIAYSGDAYGRRKHILAIARTCGGHQLGVSCGYPILIDNRHTVAITLVLPAADCPACIVGCRVEAVEVFAPWERGHCLAVVHAHRSRACQSAVGVAGRDGQGVPSRHGIDQMHGVATYKVAKHGAVPAVAYRSLTSREIEHCLHAVAESSHFGNRQ